MNSAAPLQGVVMNNRKIRSTDEFKPWKFKPRGRVTFTKMENILVCDANGHFDAELIDAVVAIQVPMISELIDQGKWGDVIVLRTNVVTPSDGLPVFTDYLRALVRRGVNPAASALVVPATADGNGSDAETMSARIVQCYRDAGLMLAVFDDVDDALAWVKPRLA